MKNKFYKTLGALLILIGLIPTSVLGQAIVFPNKGGTGTSTIPSYGKVLVGNSSGTYTLTATSSLGIQTGVISTSTNPLIVSSVTATSTNGSTVKNGVSLTNLNNATLGAQNQYSPALYLSGSAWNTSSLSSKKIEARSYLSSVAGNQAEADWNFEIQTPSQNWYRFMQMRLQDGGAPTMSIYPNIAVGDLQLNGRIDNPIGSPAADVFNDSSWYLYGPLVDSNNASVLNLDNRTLYGSDGSGSTSFPLIDFNGIGENTGTSMSFDSDLATYISKNLILTGAGPSPLKIKNLSANTGNVEDVFSVSSDGTTMNLWDEVNGAHIPISAGDQQLGIHYPLFVQGVGTANPALTVLGTNAVLQTDLFEVLLGSAPDISLAVDKNGNVGLGNSAGATLAAKLDVKAGNIYLHGDDSSFTFGDALSPQTRQAPFWMTTADNELVSNFISNYFYGDTYFGSTAKTAITSTGKIGVGTTTNLWAALGVEGTSTLGNNAIAGKFTATSTTATSTFAGGITSPCFSNNGTTCIGGFSNTLANGGTATSSFYNGGVLFSDGSKLTQAPVASDFYWDNTNKRHGLGTSTPWATLSINPNAISGPAFAIGSSTGTTFMVDNGAHVGIGTSSPSANFKLGVTGASYFSGNITTGGQIGIGKAPGAALDVSGAGAFTSSVSASGLSVTNSSSGNDLAMLAMSNTGTATGTSQSITGTSFDSGFSSRQLGKIAMVMGQNFGGANGYMRFDVLSAGTNIEGLRIDSTRNVGLSTSTPWARLSVASYNATTQFPLLAVASSSLAVASSTSLIVDWNGRVGIGTTSPSAPLASQGAVFHNGLTAFATGDSAVCQRAGGEITVDSGISSCIVSSRKVKHDIKDVSLSDSLSRLSKLDAVSFKYNNSNKPDIGLIAEDVATVDPRYAQYNEKGEPRAINWSAITADLVKVVQAGTGEAKRSAEENWQWIAIALLALIVVKQGIDIKKLKHNK